jgi:ribosome-binding factor A
MNERRIQRLESQIQHRVAEILMRELQDPKLGMVTVCRVELDSEFTQCKVYWSVFGTDKQKAQTRGALSRARGFVQREVGASLSTRTVPHLEFVFDESIAGAVKMQDTLSELRKEREDRTGVAEPPIQVEPAPRKKPD